jgi:hypothetical protein
VEQVARDAGRQTRRSRRICSFQRRAIRPLGAGSIPAAGLAAARATGW